MVCLLFPVDWVEMVTLQGPQRENFQKKVKGKRKKKGCMSDAQFLVISFDRTKLFCFVGYMCDWLKCDVGERVRVCVPVVIKVRWGVMLLDTKWCKRFDLLSSQKIYCFLTGLVRWPIVNKLLANPRCIHTYTQTKTGVLFEVKKKYFFLDVLLSSRWRSQW